MPRDAEREKIIAENAGVLECRRARSTGLLVTLYDGEAAGLDTDGGRYSTVCEPHGGIVCHSSRRTARDWMSSPESWCPRCQGDEEA